MYRYPLMLKNVAHMVAHSYHDSSCHGDIMPVTTVTVASQLRATMHTTFSA